MVAKRKQPGRTVGVQGVLVSAREKKTAKCEPILRCDHEEDKGRNRYEEADVDGLLYIQKPKSRGGPRGGNSEQSMEVSCTAVPKAITKRTKREVSGEGPISDFSTDLTRQDQSANFFFRRVQPQHSETKKVDFRKKGAQNVDRLASPPA